MPQPPALWILERKGMPAAGAIVFADGNRALPAPRPLTCYQGVFLLPPRAETHSRIRWQLETLGSLLEALSSRYRSLSFSLHPSIDDIRAFQWFNYHAPDRGRFAVDVAYTGIVDLSGNTDFDTYRAGIRMNRRRDVERSINEGMTAVEFDRR